MGTQRQVSSQRDHLANLIKASSFLDKRIAYCLIRLDLSKVNDTVLFLKLAELKKQTKEFICSTKNRN